jgi:hypothetical protein
MVSIGSKKPNAKTIQINFTKWHLFFGLVFFVVLMVFLSINNSFLYTYVICENGEKQIIQENTSIICDTNIGSYGTIEEKIKRYNDGKQYNDKLRVQRP